MRCSHVGSWQAPSKSSSARNALKYADWTTSWASSSLRMKRLATARSRPPYFRTMVSNAQSWPARSAARSSQSSTADPSAARCSFARDRASFKPAESAARVLTANIGHSLELLHDECRTVCETDAASRQLAKQGKARRVDERHTDQIDHEMAFALSVIPIGVEAHPPEFVDPRARDLTLESDNGGGGDGLSRNPEHVIHQLSNGCAARFHGSARPYNAENTRLM